MNYHSGKANVIADALSRKTFHLWTLTTKELDLIEEFRDFTLVCEVTSQSVKLGMLKLTNITLKEIKEGHMTDLILVDLLALIN